MNTHSDQGYTQLWNDIFIIYAHGALAVFAGCLLARLACGASPLELIRTRFYEIPPIRFALFMAYLGLWAVVVVSGWHLAAHGLEYHKNQQEIHGKIALFAAAAMGAAFLVKRFIYHHIIFIHNNEPPTVAVKKVKTSRGIGTGRFATLGKEQFPQMLAYGITGGLWARGILSLTAFSFAGLLIICMTDWGREQGWQYVVHSFIGSIRVEIPQLETEWVVTAGISAAICFWLLILFNFSYTLVRFSTSLLALIVMVSVVWITALIQQATDEQLCVLVGIGASACAVRWCHDLARASHFSQQRNVSVPIAAQLAESFPDLCTLKSRDDCRLNPLDESALSTRISQGCRNVEEASPLVTRNLARFLSLVHIEYEHVVAAMLRYLTVRRYVSTSFGGGTTRYLQNPVVPMWDESQFPVHPPNGYKNWLDPLGLGWVWDIVCICGSCGGSGQVTCSSCGGSGTQQRSESYTETSNGQTVTHTRTYTVTCSGCGGSGRVTCPTCSGLGRVVHHQTLNTHWQRILPTCTSPHVLVPEFMEDSEERTYFRFPIVENRVQVSAQPEHDGIKPDLVERLSWVIPGMGAKLPGISQSVEKHHDGIVYRSDFQVTGFWVLRIRFRRLPGKVGWFFGARPEFYFPALPLSWGMVGTVVLVLPFLVMTALMTVIEVTRWLNQNLPQIPRD